MFSGIIESTGVITGTAETPAGRRLRVDLGSIAAQSRSGDSIALNGVCLTVAAVSAPDAEFDVIHETLRCTTLGQTSVGDRVNVERSLRIGDRLDGHFVQGHIDGQARVTDIDRSGGEYRIWLQPAEDLLPCIIPKGSVAIDGVSMTIAAVDGPLFCIALIPVTLERTTLGALRPDSPVNIESDIIARTVAHQLSNLGGQNGSPFTPWKADQV